MIRRALGTTLVGLCALTGPLAGSALAGPTTDPVLNLSVVSARAGVPFTVDSSTGCPSALGAQTVEFSFTDSEGTSFPVGSVDTADSGAWSSAAVSIPVAGVDETGAWDDPAVATGAGTLDATCVTPDDSPDAGDPSDLSDSAVPSDRDAPDPAGDTVNLAYAPATLTFSKAAAQLAISLELVQPGGSVTLTPAEACAGTGAASVDLSILPISPISDDAGDSFDDSDSSVLGDPIAATTVTASSGGSWAPVTLSVPKNAATGDYAVTATCSRNDVVTSSYDARALAVGTVALGPVACTTRGATARLAGTYSGAVTGPDDNDLSLPTTLKLTGDGPWKVSVQSSTTDQVLLARTLACAQPKFDLTVTRTGVSDAGKVRAWACNTGRATAVAVLQLAKGKRFTDADHESLAPGDCVTLTGPRLDRGDQVKARVLIDPPGKGSSDTDIAASFTVKRGKR
jgi:hypothetical protein